jgi:REP element-mobilizing transposase RayT
MARLARYLLPEWGIYHVTTRGVARQAIARDDDDRRLFLALLARTTRRTNWDCHAFCLMPNHHHLIVATHQDLLSVGLRMLNGRYAQASTSDTAGAAISSATATPLSRSGTTITCAPRRNTWCRTRSAHACAATPPTGRGAARAARLSSSRAEG